MDWQEIAAPGLVAGVVAAWAIVLRRRRAAGGRRTIACRGCCPATGPGAAPAPLVVEGRVGQRPVIRIKLG